ncbi:hypothetical protein [Salipiger mucosus]|uniref:Uncharacterized protein n=1 Tax=Salipiger mucosus DSM 16094 TaxID=1123237 RepID=S9Q6L6_9RHOB|nr:hypothetical protein [Salipiger mucosus]EPX75642.1 hypothetical protein Salmuc_04560 [Salipiger mucosus DSM 16094]
MTSTSAKHTGRRSILTPAEQEILAETRDGVRYLQSALEAPMDTDGREDPVVGLLKTLIEELEEMKAQQARIHAALTDLRADPPT